MQIAPINRDYFLLDPSVTYLNHGGFGAPSKVVMERCEQIRRLCNENPTRFMQRQFPAMLKKTRQSLASFLGTDPDNIVPVLNATHGVNEVVASLAESLLKPGDSVVTTNQEYGAMDLTWQRYAEVRGFHYRQQDLSVPIKDKEGLISDLWQAVTQETKIIYVSHINSPTAMIMPVKEICARAKEAGIYTVVDGAHAPGQVPLHLDSLGADFYIGNLHKWLGVPLTAGFIYAKQELQSLLKPLIVSFGFSDWGEPVPPFIRQHNWMGTLDYCPFLSTPAAIQFFEENHWPMQQKRCHALAQATVEAINAMTGHPPLYPLTAEWHAQMAVTRLPDEIDVDKFRGALEEKHKIEVPCHRWSNYNLIRVSFQAYNTEADIDKLLSSMKEEF